MFNLYKKGEDMSDNEKFQGHECDENMCSFEFPKQILMVVTNTTRGVNGEKTGVWFEEFAVPYLAFLEQGYEVTVASPIGDAAPIDPASDNLINDVKWAAAKKALNAPLKLDTVDYMVFDALVLPGGHGPMVDLSRNETLGKIVNYFASQDKLIAAICHGPAGLLSAVKDGIPFVNGKRVTCFTNEEEIAAKKQDLIPFYLEDALKTEGAFFIQEGVGVVNVVEDGNLITAQNYQSTKLFTDTIIKHLAENN